MTAPKKMREHPYDRRLRLEAQAMAKEHGRELLASKRRALEDLLITYADIDAEERLGRLREWFWGGALDRFAANRRKA